MIETLIAILTAIGLSCLLRPPDLYGLATHYGPPGWENGDLMRNGEPLDLDAPTVAVNDCRKDDDGQCLYDWDIPYWPRWANKDAIVFVST